MVKSNVASFLAQYKTFLLPEVLLSGHHGKVDEWRRQQSLKRTLERRPDLLEGAKLDKKDEEFLRGLKK